MTSAQTTAAVAATASTTIAGASAALQPIPALGRATRLLVAGIGVAAPGATRCERA